MKGIKVLVVVMAGIITGVASGDTREPDSTSGWGTTTIKLKLRETVIIDPPPPEDENPYGAKVLKWKALTINCHAAKPGVWDEAEPSDLDQKCSKEGDRKSERKVIIDGRCGSGFRTGDTSLVCQAQ